MTRATPPLSLPLITLTVLLASCRSPFAREDDFKVPPEEFQGIQTVDLAEKSTTAPVSIEEATRSVIENIVRPPPAPATLDLTLADVRAASIANNLDLKVEVMSPAVAQESVNEEEAKFEWTFIAAARRNVTDSPTALGTEGSQGTLDAYDLGLDIPLRTGGFARVNFPLSESETNNPFSLLNPAYSSDLRFSISQPLLRNAWERVNTHSIRVARYDQQIVGARTKLEVIRILANADRAYWRLYAARRQLEVRQQQYEVAVTQLEQARRKVNMGDVAEIEIIRAESGVAERLEAIIITQSLVRRRQRDLKRIMNRDDLPMNSPTEIIALTEPQPAGLELDADALAALAVANRMEMLELELQIAIDNSTIEFTRNQKLPLVTLDYAYAINGLGESYNEALGQIPDHSFEDWALGVSAEIPLGNEAAKARHNGAILQRLQRLATKDQRSASIRQEVFDALDQLEQDWQRILAARQEALLAGRTFEAEQRQFSVGERTSTDVLDAAARLADAQSSEIQALADYQVTQVDIAFATGTLLGHDRIRWEPYSKLLIEEPKEGEEAGSRPQ